MDQQSDVESTEEIFLCRQELKRDRGGNPKTYSSPITPIKTAGSAVSKTVATGPLLKHSEVERVSHGKGLIVGGPLPREIWCPKRCYKGKAANLSQSLYSAQSISSCIANSWATPNRKRQLLGHKERVFDFEFHPTQVHGSRSNQYSNHSVSCSEDGTVKIWDLARGSCKYNLPKHKDEALRVCWAPGGMASAVSLASGSADGAVKVWSFRKDKSSFRSLCTLDHTGPGLDGQVYALQFLHSHTRTDTPSGLRLMSASDSTVKIWDVNTQTLASEWVFQPVRGSAAIGGVRNPEGHVFVFDAKASMEIGTGVVAAALSDGTVRVSNLNNANSIAVLSAPSHHHTNSNFGPAGCSFNNIGTSITSDHIDLQHESGGLLQDVSYENLHGNEHEQLNIRIHENVEVGMSGDSPRLPSLMIAH